MRFIVVDRRFRIDPPRRLAGFEIGLRSANRHACAAFFGVEIWIFAAARQAARKPMLSIDAAASIRPLRII
jgi:hypothetical protein